MPTYLVKAAPGDRWYCLWSTVVDSPTWVGDREGLDELPEVTPERIERADRTGTSSLDGFYSWQDEHFHVGESSPNIEGQLYYLPRARLGEYIRLALACIDAGDGDLIGTHRLLESEEWPAAAGEAS